MLWPTRNAGYRAGPMESGCTFATSVDCLGQILPILRLPEFLNELFNTLCRGCPQNTCQVQSMVVREVVAFERAPVLRLSGRPMTLEN